MTKCLSGRAAGWVACGTSISARYEAEREMHDEGIE